MYLLKVGRGAGVCMHISTFWMMKSQYDSRAEPEVTYFVSTRIAFLPVEIGGDLKAARQANILILEPATTLLMPVGSWRVRFCSRV